jgi:hypothetical protein
MEVLARNVGHHFRAQGAGPLVERPDVRAPTAPE